MKTLKQIIERYDPTYSVNWDNVFAMCGTFCRPEQQGHTHADLMETGLQAEIERERERRFESNRIASAEHRDELERLVGALEKIADLELPGTDGATEFSRSQDRWRKFLEAQGIAESAIAQYREEPVTHDQAPCKSVKTRWHFGDPDKPLTVDEYLAGLTLVKGQSK